MRLDKFLKVSRIIKRRTIANEACDAGKVEVGTKINSYKVLAINEHALKEDAAKMYEIL